MSLKFVPGTTYDISHLRPLPDNWQELVDAGHPLADIFGGEVRHLRRTSDEQYAFDYWYEHYPVEFDWNVSFRLTEDAVTSLIRLAPIAVKDGKPLHLGDLIERIGFSPTFINSDFNYGLMREILAGYEWRWPVEKKPCQA